MRLFRNRITPSMSLTSPGVSQWTVNENSYGTQTTQTDNHWSVQHGDSFESYKSYSTNGETQFLQIFQFDEIKQNTFSAYGSGSKLSIGKHNRSRSCPSVRCALCKHRHYGGLRISESMHYTPRVTFQDTKSTAARGSLPDLARPDCACGCQSMRGTRRRVAHQICESFDSGSSLDEANDLLRESVDILPRDVEHCQFVPRRSSENDIQNKSKIYPIALMDSKIQFQSNYEFTLVLIRVFALYERKQHSKIYQVIVIECHFCQKLGIA